MKWDTAALFPDCVKTGELLTPPSSLWPPCFQKVWQPLASGYLLKYKHHKTISVFSCSAEQAPLCSSFLMPSARLDTALCKLFCKSGAVQSSALPLYHILTSTLGLDSMSKLMNALRAVMISPPVREPPWK